ncbi:ABC transporter ATP-binding protein [Actinomadura darangshiensis]|uniref:ABC transporter ATP-binding protein n=1 Tax=Actinomadura darangshiensis TaxID=705336 RepID=A0A4R5B284_9ACTN|nr:ABC transporter ATP-binding protein [Actinomadura darangshiensis]TDD79255.1 ABC transporter ATP-binding protein [Actinomadura darangshiensis]
MTLVLDSLAVSRGRTAVLHEISLTAGDGEFVCLLGPNGAGKTTVLDTLAGLLRPRAGTLTWDGADLARVPTHRLVSLGISYAMEGRRLFKRLSVADNLMLGVPPRTPRTAAAERLAWVHELFPALAERPGDPAGALSGGQQQMLVIAQALMCRPRLLLLDEPSAGLAPRLVAEVFGGLRRLREDGDGPAVLLVEQDTGDALALCDRGYVIDNGRVAFDGTCDDLADDPRVRAVYLGVTAPAGEDTA